MKYGLDCVFYYVRDIERSTRFYSEVLGLPLMSRDSVARFDLDGLLLELVPTEDESKLAGAGNARVCFVVPEIDPAISELKAQGVAIGEVRTVDNGKLARFEDPEGNELALWQYT